jgi:tryptophan halogenase
MSLRSAIVDRYNELSRYEIEEIRDFVCMHYHLTQRDDTPFWRHCSKMEIPESLASRIELFKQNGYAYFNEGQPFPVASWVAVMLGQNIKPQGYHHYARMDETQLNYRVAAPLHQSCNSAEPTLQRTQNGP